MSKSFHIIKHNLNVLGDILVEGTVDGRDIATDGSVQDLHIAATSGVHGVTGDVVGTSDAQTLSNKTLVDGSTTFQDDLDNTKQIRFQLSGVSAGETRIISFPDADTTLVGTDTSQVLTGKSIDADNNTLSNIADAEIKAGANINASKLGTGVVSNTEFNYLNGVGSQLSGNSDAATLTNKTWGDDLNMGTYKITNLGIPTNDTDAATKLYVDSVAQGLDAKESVRAKTVTALPSYTQSGSGSGATLTADANGVLPDVDGVTLVVGDRVLIDQNGSQNNADNGIYTVTQVGDGSNPWILTRATDADNNAEVTSGMYVFIEEGSITANNGYVLATDGLITVDTTELSFVQFTGAGQVSVDNVGTAGVGLFKEKTGNTLRFKNLNAGSSRVSITDDTGDSEVDIDVVESNIQILNLSGAPSSAVVGVSDSQTLSNKTIDAESNTVSNIADAEIKSGANINVAKLGTGVVSNTEFNYLNGLSGNIQTQIDNHTSATSGVHGVTGDVVGTTDSQTLSNKTLSAPTVQGNLDLESSYLQFQDISTPSNPGDGFGRLYKKTGDPCLWWRSDSSEPEVKLSQNNAGTNIGVAGVGVFKQVNTDLELEFKQINSGSNKITITDDTANDEIDIDLVEANIVHDNLSGAGSYTHAQLDAHLDNTSNPHNVTASQVGNSTAQWNADQLQGVAVSSTAPSDGQYLVYDALQSEWVPKRGSRSTTTIFDDFVTSSLLNIWLVECMGSNSTADVIDGVGGQVNITSDSNTNDYAELRVSNKTVTTSSNFQLAGRFKLSSNINTNVEFGLYDDADNLIRFVYDKTATPGNWNAETRASSVSTLTDTTVAADTNWHVFEVHGSSSEIKFYIDGTLRATNSSNLPTSLLRIYLRQTSNSTSSRTTTLDYVEAISDRES